MKYCCFIGAKTMTQKEEEIIREDLKQAIYYVLEKDAYGFVYTGCSGFELVAFEILLEMRDHNPQKRHGKVR